MTTIELKPERYCDIVMKGGVTSGILYPLAVCELAQKYRFVNIGGTSAGAIAAAVTAAAEYRRAHGDSRGFSENIVNLPKHLGERLPDGSTRLLSLFRPNPSTKRVYDALLRMARGGTLTRVLAGIRGLFTISPGLAWLGVLLVVGLLAVMWVVIPLVIVPVALSIMVLAGLIIAAIPPFLAWSCVKRTASLVVGNSYGLCTGHIKDHEGDPYPPLTEWLADFLDTTANKDSRLGPLTFGDLWGVAAEGTDGREKINLQMMTTNLTLGRPYQLPFEQKDLCWDPVEFCDLFPERIVRWMQEHSTPHPDQQRFWLPPPEMMPVIVAVRMSLSFPFLISAVPLWATDYTRFRNKGLEKDGKPTELERCWFSDGGICSNFPVHFFDSPLPRWPTFGINLRPFHPDFKREEDERKNIWMPEDNGQGRLEQWVRFDQASPISSILGFGRTIVDTMQNWVDNTQLKVPGYRDRVAHVFLTKDEGGLNLDMEEGEIGRLGTRGMFAGQLLRERFTGGVPSCPLDWDNHRWVRYRSTMTLLERYLHGIASRYRSPAPGTGKTYEELVARGCQEPPPAYRLANDQRTLALDMGTKLMQLMEEWSKYSCQFEWRTPEPIPELRIRPKM